MTSKMQQKRSRPEPSFTDKISGVFGANGRRRGNTVETLKGCVREYHQAKGDTWSYKRFEQFLQRYFIRKDDDNSQPHNAYYIAMVLVFIVCDYRSRATSWQESSLAVKLVKELQRETQQPTRIPSGMKEFLNLYQNIIRELATVPPGQHLNEESMSREIAITINNIEPFYCSLPIQNAEDNIENFRKMISEFANPT
eukprot:gb/GECG01002894.1/.p1 GENE.gb/GECG01002894.1/~~gb/GECG01002894.1/.p1  ORF type:complete len:197 (+),score=19.39 gb/GECG01002894.1/:1-591(+)